MRSTRPVSHACWARLVSATYSRRSPSCFSCSGALRLRQRVLRFLIGSTRLRGGLLGLEVGACVSSLGLLAH